MLWLYIEFIGLRISWETVTFINALRFLSPEARSYRISLLISMILIRLYFLSLESKFCLLIYTKLSLLGSLILLPSGPAASFSFSKFNKKIVFYNSDLSMLKKSFSENKV